MVAKKNDDNESLIESILDTLKYVIKNKTGLFVALIVLGIFAVRINFHFETECKEVVVSKEVISTEKNFKFLISMSDLDDVIRDKK